MQNYLSMNEFIQEVYILIIDTESSAINIINIDEILTTQINILIENKNIIKLIIIFILKIGKFIKIKTIITHVISNIKLLKYIINSIIYIFKHNDLKNIYKIYNQIKNILNYNERAIAALQEALENICPCILELLLLRLKTILGKIIQDYDLLPIKQIKLLVEKLGKNCKFLTEAVKKFVTNHQFITSIIMSAIKKFIKKCKNVSIIQTKELSDIDKWLAIPDIDKYIVIEKYAIPPRGVR